MAEFQLSIVAPDRTVFEGSVAGVVVPGVEGYLGILANHEPLIAALMDGIVEARNVSGDITHIAINGGFLESSDNKVIILANDAILAKDVDIADTEKELEQARRALKGEDSEMSTDQAEDVVRRAITRIKAARKVG